MTNHRDFEHMGKEIPCEKGCVRIIAHMICDVPTAVKELNNG